MMRLVGVTLLLAAVGCDRGISDPPVPPPLSLDIQLRQAIGQWGVIGIGPVPQQNPAMVSLGQSLFFDKVLSGNRDVSCATCHDPLASAVDGLALAIGTGGAGSGPTRSLGAGRRFVPRNAPTLINAGLGLPYSLWDGRVNNEGSLTSQFKAPPGIVLPAGLNNLLAAQAMLPVLSRVEMRGDAGDRDAFGNVNELAQFGDSETSVIWKGVMQRLLAIQEYADKFAAAYPGIPTQSLGFQHAANALAAFQIANFTKTNSAFDRYLAHDDRALTDEQKRGALVFFGNGLCSSCHSGPFLGGFQFANVGTPQIGPGVGAAAPLDIGRGEQFPTTSFYQFAFRVPPLRNVELTAPYMHNGAYATLDLVIRHYTNPDSALRAFDVGQLDPALRDTYHGDEATINKVMLTLAPQLRSSPLGFPSGGIKLSEVDRAQLIAFLKSLTDPAAQGLAAVIPASVPSGLPIR
ncbi:MAG TPA: cytochrome c peroxidase [Gemmatimonadaceae bacterium]|nr:cytochrome c peroxidase [Gemmatimonadaceae bacterium]